MRTAPRLAEETTPVTDSLTMPPASSAFTPRRALRSAAALTSGGLVVGLGAVGATPAFAATAADCTDSNTVDAATDSAAAIQTLLDADTAIVCLAGNFPLTSTLTFDHGLTLFGLDDAQLDGGDATQLLSGTTGASLVVQNIAFSNGFATRGGAINIDGNLQVENSTFTSNAAAEDGGAIYVIDDEATVVIEGSTFADNSTGELLDGFDGYSGGAVYVEGDNVLYIGDSTFSGNEASAAGGAVYAYAAITETSTFDDNTAPIGGAMYSGISVSYESTYASNSAESGGAIESVIYGASFGSTFVENDAETFGGALSVGAFDLDEGPIGYGAAIIVNSTFVENSAGELGGAVLAGYGQVALSTFLDNRAEIPVAQGHSEAIFATGGDDGTDTIQFGGNIFAGSRSNAQLGAIDDDIYDDLGGNVFSTTESVEAALSAPDDSTLFNRSVADIFGANPQLADNGGATSTVALIGTSPAINAVPELAFGPVSASLEQAMGDLSSASELMAAVDSVDVDQRNEPRDGLADAGAFEYGEPELAATGPDTSSASVLGALAALMLGAGALIVARSRRLVRTHPND